MFFIFYTLDQWAKAADATHHALLDLKTSEDVMIQTGSGFLAIPAHAATLAQIANEHPDATIVSGATDVGLWVTKQMRELPKIIPTVHIISSAGCPARPDHLHFTPAGYRELGKRYGQKMLSLLRY